MVYFGLLFQKISGTNQILAYLSTKLITKFEKKFDVISHYDTKVLTLDVTSPLTIILAVTYICQ